MSKNWELAQKRKSAGHVLPTTVLLAQMSKKRKSAGKAKISRISLVDYCFAFANEQESKIGWKSENQQDKSCLLPLYVRNEQEAKISSTSLAYYRLAFANEQEAKISSSSLAYYRFAFANEQEAKISRQVLPIAVVRPQMSKNRKSA